MGRFLKILGGLIALISFSAYYQHAYSCYPSIEAMYIKLLHYGYFVGISMIIFGIGKDEVSSRIKYLIYYPMAWFFMFTFIAYIANDYFDDLVTMHKTLVSIFLTLLACPISFLASYWLKR